MDSDEPLKLSTAGSKDDASLLFVYGTLRRGAKKAALMGRRHYLQPMTVSGTLYAFRYFPALILGGTGIVHGDLWRCEPETLASLDTYEGVEQGLFRRVRITSGDIPCWTYVAGPELKAGIASARVIASGDWLSSRASPGHPDIAR